MQASLSRLAALTGAVLAIVACGGGEPKGTDTAATNAPMAAPGSTGTAAAAPATGKTWDVKMLGDDKGYRYDPETLTIKSGDAVRWTVVSGIPHNVTFWEDSIPAAGSAQLSANMTATVAPFTGPMLSAVNDTYTMSFAGVPPGTYGYYCTPHLALGMKGKIVVQ